MLLILIVLFAELLSAQNTPVYPSSVATNTDLLIATNISALNPKLATALTASSTTITTTTNNFVAPLAVTIDNEIIKICSATSITLTVCSGGRGFDGSAPASHLANATVRNTIVAWYHNQIAAEVRALEGFLGANGATQAARTETLTNKTISGANNTLTIREADFSFTDTLTANATTIKHGLLPKLTGDATQAFCGDGVYRTTCGGSGGVTLNTTQTISGAKTFTGGITLSGSNVGISGTVQIGQATGGQHVNSMFVDSLSLYGASYVKNGATFTFQPGSTANLQTNVTLPTTDTYSIGSSYSAELLGLWASVLHVGNSIAFQDAGGSANNNLKIYGSAGQLVIDAASGGGGTDTDILLKTSPAGSGSVTVLTVSHLGDVQMTSNGTFAPLTNAAGILGSGSLRWARAYLSKANVTLHTPSSSSETCITGDVFADTGFVYVCTTTNTLKRATLASF